MPRPGLLEIARRRAPGATLIQGELQTLPFDDDMFDAVSGFNSLQYAADPIAALQEAKRVTCPGGRILALVWSAADMCELAPHLRSLGALMPAPPPGTPGPFALCGRDALEEFSAAAGLEVAEVSDVPCTFAYPTPRPRSRRSAAPVRRPRRRARRARGGSGRHQNLPVEPRPS